jgi:anti-sigma factor RsiW
VEKEVKMRSCRKWQIILGEYVLGTIDERDRARLERHLARCPRCRRDLVQTEKTYQLLGPFELAKPGPYFAAKLSRAVQREAEAAAPGTTGERARAGLRRWLRTPALASAVAAASVAIVATVLYVKVWLPHVPEGVEVPAAGKVASAARAEKAAELTAAAAEERPARKRRTARAEAALPGEAGPIPRETAAAAEPAAKKEPYLVAGAPHGATAAAEADKLATLAPRPARAEAVPPSEAAPPSGETAATEKAAMTARPAKEKGRGIAEAPYPAKATAVADSLAGPAAAAGSGASRDEMGRYRRSAVDDVKRPEFAELGEESIVAADVEAWMDPRFEADVERLTGDGAALVDYVTPNGSLMAYFYELPVDEQKTLLSRLRREAEAASAADLLLSH